MPVSDTTSCIVSSTLSVKHRSRPTQPYFPALDGLRAVSFLGVFFWHYLGLPYGWAGVDVFFVLSGFLITGILFDTRDDPHRVRNFYIRRTLRIFPLYYGTLFAALICTPLLHWEWSWQWIAWPLYLGNFLQFLYPHVSTEFISNFVYGHLVSQLHPRIVLRLGHFWTLCVEEQFYLFWPWIVFTVRGRRKLMLICLFFIFLVPIARTYAAVHLPQVLADGGIVFRATFFRFDTLLVGALLALLYRGSHRRQLQRVAQVLLASFLLCAILVIGYWERFHSYDIYNLHLHHPWRLTLIALFAGVLISRTLVPGTIAYRAFNLRWLRRIGTVSYGAYVFHDILHSEYLRLIAHFFHGPKVVDYITAGFALFTTLGLAFLSYRFFELPILMLRNRFTSES